jgi:phage terminase large subunit
VATSSNAAEVAKRRPGRPPKAEPERLTFVSDFATTFFPELHASAGIKFPSPIYRDDPVRFGREILGVDYWSKQVEILEAVRDHPRVAVKSGHKVGKSHAAASLALWFYASFDAARVCMTSTTARQVDAILWRELRMMYARAGKCLDCKVAEQADPTLRIPRPCAHSSLLDGEIGDLARTGLHSNDFREVVGFTARQAEAVAGISGANVLYIGDEASGIPELIFEAIEGNRAGNARLALFSNPTKNSGTFYDAFNSKSRFYKTITVSSEETPNVKAGRIVTPGLATREWVEEKKEEWGVKSALYLVRVKGDFAEHEEGKIFSLHDITQAELRWPETPLAGRLWIGLDPAGVRGQGDEIVFAPRRGYKLIEFRIRRGLDEAGHLSELLRVIKDHALPREVPVVVVDAEGEIGSKVANTLRNYADDTNAFELVRVRASDKSHRDPMLYHLMRDALAANLAAWFDQGGAIPEDAKLVKELHSMDWRLRPDGRAKVTDKTVLRKILGRSPDRYDGLALSCWEPTSLREDDGTDNRPRIPRSTRDAETRATSLDPYAGTRAWERR